MSAVDIAVRGQGAVAGTDGAIQGTLADGVMQGRLRAGGADLSLLIPASPASWQTEAPFVADASRIEANAVSLSLGGAPAEGALVLHIERPARLEGQLHAATLDLNGWAALLGRGLPAGRYTGAALPTRIGLSADFARLLGGSLRHVQATLVLDGRRAGFDHAEAGLPGGARLSSDTVDLVRAENGQLAASGMARLSAPDLGATLAWLRELAPGLAEAVPEGGLRQAELTGRLTLQAGRGAVAGLAGEVDGAAVSGDASLRADGRPSLAATLRVAELPLDAWLGGSVAAGSLAGLAGHFTHADTSLHIRAAHAALLGQTLDDLDLTASTGADGLRVERAQAMLYGARLGLAGAVAADGRVDRLRFTASTASLEALLPHLPAPARLAEGFWHGGADLQVAADGPADAVSIQVRADADDLVLEADSVRDTRAGGGTTTVTLRHPGAPRLLADVGLPRLLGLPAGLAPTARWLDTGALTLLAHFQDTPSRLVVRDFDLNAAALRLSGSFSSDWSGRVPALTGSLAFEQLALPDTLPGLKELAGLAAWTARFHVSAATVTSGLRPVAGRTVMDLSAGGGKAALRSVAAEVAGGRLTGQADADFAAPHVAASARLTGAAPGGRLTGWPIDLVSATAELGLALELAGSSLADFSGTVHAQLQDASLVGFDLAQLAAAAPLHTQAGRLALKMALSQGTSPGLAGTVDAAVAGGVLTLPGARLVSRDGAAEISLSADLARATVNARLRLTPAVPGSASFGVRLSGPWQGPSVTVEDRRARR